MGKLLSGLIQIVGAVLAIPAVVILAVVALAIALPIGLALWIVVGGVKIKEWLGRQGSNLR